MGRFTVTEVAVNCSGSRTVVLEVVACGSGCFQNWQLAAITQDVNGQETGRTKNCNLSANRPTYALDDLNEENEGVLIASRKEVERNQKKEEE